MSAKKSSKNATAKILAKFQAEIQSQPFYYQKINHTNKKILIILTISILSLKKYLKILIIKMSRFIGLSKYIMFVERFDECF